LGDALEKLKGSHMVRIFRKAITDFI